jgi:uncharacterized cupredoxin-like copper-binding protein
VRTLPAAALALAVMAGVGVACTQASGGGPTLEISLKDYEVTVSPETVPSGTITLEATSEGPSVHEVEIFQVPDGTDAGDLPVKEGVAVTDGLTLVDEVEDLVPGSTADLTLDLQPGTYAVICNVSGHYAHGMHTTFTVG